MMLTYLLDLVDCDTKVILYYGEQDRIGEAEVSRFPDRHDMNIFYGNEVEYISSTGINEIIVMLKGKDPR